MKMLQNPKAKKIIRYIKTILTIILYVITIDMIFSPDPQRKISGWIIITIIITWNAYALYKYKDFLKQLNQYIQYVAKEKAKEKRK